MPIMLVDDTQDVLEVLAFWLQQAGYAVHAYDNAADALAALRSGLQPSLIVLDLYMPVMTGFDFRTAQLADERLASIPVVVLSGHPATDQEKAALGAVRLLEKPVEPEILLAIIRAHRVPLTATGRSGSP